MPVDLKQFLPYVEHCDLTEEQKLEILADLWSIMESFADDAWDVVPKHDFANDNEQLSRIKSLNAIDSLHPDNNTERARLAGPKAPARKE